MGEKSSKKEFRDMLMEMLEEPAVLKRLRDVLGLAVPEEFNNKEKDDSDVLPSSEANPERNKNTETLLQEKEALEVVIYTLQREAQAAAEQVQEHTKKISELQGKLHEGQQEKLCLIAQLQAGEQRERELQATIQVLQQAKEGAEAQWQQQKRQSDLQISVLRQEKQSLEDQKRLWQGEKDKLQDQVKTLEWRLGPVRPWQEAYMLYQKLAPDIQKELQGIFTTSSLDGFIACGVQGENIWSLWDYAQIKCQAGDAKDLSVLQSLVDFFLSQHNLTFSAPRYVAQVVQVGEEFDVAKHIRSRDSKAAGRIASVCIQGYENRQTGKIVKKSIVRV